MSDFGFALLMFTFVAATFVSGVLVTGETPTYKLGKESKLLIDECELNLPRDQFCELVAKPKGDVNE